MQGGGAPLLKNGQGGNRTPDAQIFSLPLYRLSYLPYYARDFVPSFVGQAW